MYSGVWATSADAERLYSNSKGIRTSVCSKSTTTKRVMLLELEAMKKQEEIDEQVAAKKRQAEIRKKHEEMDKLTEE